MSHPGDDDLALLALGEPLPEVAKHVSACPDCAREVLALSSTVATARRSDLADLPAPPAAVWDRIADELGLAQETVAHPDDVVVPQRRSPWRRPLALAAAGLSAAAVAVAVLVGLQAARPAAPGEVTVPLTALADTRARGEAVLAADARTRSLVVDTAGLPAADGFYEVWLLDVDSGRLVALGALDDTGRARLTVPEGVRLADYPVIDVSLEPDDGDPGHSGDSVLRGALRL